jgi:hypothetical protein
MNMKSALLLFGIVCLSFLALQAKVLPPAPDQDTGFLIDDFSKDDGRSALGTAWRSFSDQVMGGLSEGRHRFQEWEGERCVRLTGEVSLDNNGGFIQVALTLASQNRAFDASSYQGIRIRVRGNKARYFLHLRSTQTQRPWQYYAADFEATDEWRTLEIPFSRFEAENLQEALNTGELLRVALVGAWQEFEVDVAVSRIEFYR